MNSLVGIGVPSKNRPEAFMKYTFRILQHTKVPWYVFVEPQDLERYKKTLPLEYRGNIIEIGSNDRGFGFVLNEIESYLTERGHTYTFKIDDDCKHWYDSPKVKPKEDQGVMLDKIVNRVGEAHKLFGDTLGAVSFASNYFHGDWRPWTHVYKQHETMFVVRNDSWFVPSKLKGYHDELVTTANLFLKGKVSLRCGEFCWAADLSVLEGGLQDFDREEEQSRYFDVLVKEFPVIASMTQRQEYTQPSGKIFSVTNKKCFNKRFSHKLPLKPSAHDKFSKEILRCLLKLVS
jgi:hypothetical protein